MNALSMKLRNLLIIRHGSCDRYGFLTYEGRRAIEALQTYLAIRYGFTPTDTLLLHSHMLRTLKTGQALLPRIETVEERSLFSDDGTCDTKSALAAIAKYQDLYPNIVAITHFEMTGRLPNVFGKAILGASFGSYEVGYAQGFAIDCEKKTCELVFV